MWTVTVLATAVLIYSIVWLPLGNLNFFLVGLMVITIFLAPAIQIRLPRTKVHLSFTEAAIFFTILLYGFEIAVILAALETFFASYSFRGKGINIKTRTIFANVSINVVITFLSGLTVQLLFPETMAAKAFEDTPLLVGILSVIAFAQFMGTSILITIYDALRSTKRLLQVFNDNCVNALIMYAVGGTVAGLMIKTWSRIDPILLFVTATVAAITYFTYRRYVDDIQNTAAKAEQAERKRAEQAEQHVVELQHHIVQQEQTEKALRESKERFRHAAFHDALTDLPNRNLFLNTLKFQLEKSHHKLDLNFAVLFLDLNRFKTINDSLGHSIGNKLILHVAKRLSNIVKESDLVARFSGDEFAIILNDISGLNDAIEVAETVSRILAKPFNLNGRKVFTSVSIGITMSNSRYTEAEEILRDADIAMYHAKEKEKNYTVFDRNMHTRAVTLLQIETDLRMAIERDELVVFYQPIIDLDSLELMGFESLMRWQHPVRGLVPPNEFIPVSEVTGLIVPMTLWILRESCRQIVEWEAKFSNADRLVVSVNLSGKHFAQPDLVEQVQKILNETGLNPKRLKLEITESAVMENAENAIRMLKQLRQIGVQISIDDFGTGYSSLSYLHRFPINTLKVDRSFVSTMENGTENGEIVRTIIALAKTLNLSVIAEGIESIHQLHQLRVLGCEYGQGYLFSRPVPEDEATRLLSDSHRWKTILPRHRSGTINHGKEFSVLELDELLPDTPDVIQ